MESVEGSLSFEVGIRHFEGGIQRSVEGNQCFVEGIQHSAEGIRMVYFLEFQEEEEWFQGECLVQLGILVVAVRHLVVEIQLGLIRAMGVLLQASYLDRNWGRFQVKEVLCYC